MVLDPSVMEIAVIAVDDPKKALSTLKIQRDNIDLIITDYYMPGMNGLQLKKQITQEFGNLPVLGNIFCSLQLKLNYDIYSFVIVKDIFIRLFPLTLFLI